MTTHDSAPTPDLAYGVDIIAGSTYALGSYALSEQDSINFAAAWDPQIFHVDLAAAAAGAYGGLIASGIQTIAIYERLVVLAVFSGWSIIAGRGLRDVRFLRPLRPGDMVSGAMKVDTVHFDARNRALVTTTGELTNQADETVLRLVMEVYVRAQPERTA